mmetsp:Transcript_3598/g.6532  ORF Transcript_3598/g.6532 Transcript_3598/m.6532 type:complete len:362 (+) Transcript_3598:85-1170(+)
MSARAWLRAGARGAQCLGRPRLRSFATTPVPVREHGALRTVRGTEAVRVEPRSTAAAAVGSTAASIKNRAESVGRKLTRGSSDGVAYAADSPVLGKYFGPAPADAVPSEPQRRATETFHMPATSAAAPAPAEPRRSLAELRCLSASELRQMLATRGVGQGAATDKDALAEWAFQHQDLPVVRGAAQAASSRATARSSSAQKTSLQELRNMSAAELRRMLAERGVSQGSATEKSELVQWVWQHMDLPVKYEGATGQRGGIGGHGQTRTHRSTRTGGKDLVATEDPAEEEDDEAAEQLRLTEGTSSDKEQQKSAARWRWMWGVVAAGTATLLCLVAAVVANDAQQAAASRPEESETPVQSTAG